MTVFKLSSRLLAVTRTIRSSMPRTSMRSRLLSPLASSSDTLYSIFDWSGLSTGSGESDCSAMSACCRFWNGMFSWLNKQRKVLVFGCCSGRQRRGDVQRHGERGHHCVCDLACLFPFFLSRLSPLRWRPPRLVPIHVFLSSLSACGSLPPPHCCPVFVAPRRSAQIPIFSCPDASLPRLSRPGAASWRAPSFRFAVFSPRLPLLSAANSFPPTSPAGKVQSRSGIFCDYAR